MLKVLLLPLLAWNVFAVTVFRVDPTPVMTVRGNAPAGGFPALYAVANAQITLCADANCNSFATSYQDSTGNVSCPQQSPVTLPGVTPALCTQFAGAQGQFGFWLPVGLFYFKVTLSTGQAYGPFPLSVSGNGTSQFPIGTQTQYLQIQPNTGNASTLRWNNLPTLAAADFTYSQQPGGTLTGGGGAQVVSMTPCPLGIFGSGSWSPVYISGGTGAAEAITPSGGNCSSNPDGLTSGNIIIAPANNHSLAWTVQSATAGGAEAYHSSANPVRVIFPAGTSTVHAAIIGPVGGPAVAFSGVAQEATTIQVASDFPLSAAGVFVGQVNSSQSGFAVSDMTIKFTQPDSTNVGSYTHWPAAITFNGGGSVYHSHVNHVALIAAWDGISMQANDNGAFFSDIIGSYFHYFFDIHGVSGDSFDSVRVLNTQGTTTGLTANQGTAFLASGTGNIGFYVGSVSDLVIDGSEINSALAADFHTGSDTFAAGSHLSNLWWEGQIHITDGTLDIVNWHASGGAAGLPFLAFGGGDARISNCRLFYRGNASAITATAALATVSVPIPNLQVSNCWFDLGSDDVQGLVFSSGAPYSGYFPVQVNDSYFSHTTNVNYANAWVTVTNGTGDVRFTGVGNRFSPVGTGSGTAINLASDNYHVIAGTECGGWVGAIGGTTKTLWSSTNVNCTGITGYVQGPLKGLGKSSFASLVPLIGPNYIASETGGNNAIAGALTDAAGVNVPVADGLCVTVQLAHTLQAGGNTFALNGGTARSIKSHLNAANDIGTPYAATGRWTGCYNTTGPVWLDMSQ